MIHFIVATSSEARPIIDFYRLKKKEVSNFVIYNNDAISLTISGIGKINAAMSITHTFHEFNQQKNNVWINLGLAGHKNKKIGDIFLVDKIIDNETQEKKYPIIIDNCKIEQQSCITFNKENFNYTKSLYDMEVSGFFFGCEKYTIKEFIHSIKIISDNENKKITFSNKEVIKNLFIKRIEKIDLFKKKIYSIWIDHFGKKKKIDSKIKNTLSNYKLSFSEEIEFKKWLLMYFSKNSNFKTDIIDLNKDFKTNIKIIKKKLNQ